MTRTCEPSHSTRLPTTLSTVRLRLRGPVSADAQRIAMFLGDRAVAEMLATVPHPYTEADAARWITEPGDEIARYVVVHANGVIGAVGLKRVADVRALELGYWLAKPFWGRGYMTEAARAVIIALRACDARTPVTCAHFADNDRSARVIRKLGFVPAGMRDIACASRGNEVRSLTYRLSAAAPVAVNTPSLSPLEGARHVS